VYRPKSDEIIPVWNRGRLNAYLKKVGIYPIPINVKLWINGRS